MGLQRYLKPQPETLRIPPTANESCFKQKDGYICMSNLVGCLVDRFVTCGQTRGFGQNSQHLRHKACRSNTVTHLILAPAGL